MVTGSQGTYDNTRLPLFYVPADKKTQKLWSRQMLDYVSGSNVLAYSRPRRDLYQRYYNMLNGIFNAGDYKYVWATFGDAKPMSFVNYPLLYPIINYIVGQFLKPEYDFDAYKVNANAVSERMNLEAEMLFLELAKPYWEKFKATTGQDITLDQRMDILPPKVKEYFKYDFRDLEERLVKDGLKYVILKHDVKGEFAKMLYDLLVTGDCFGKIEYVDGDPVPRRVDPRTVIADRGIDDYVFRVMDKNWDYCFEEHYMMPSEVLYEYEHYMSEEDKERFKQNIESYMRYGDRRMWNTNFCKYYYADKEGLRVRVLKGQWIARNQMPFPKDFDEATGQASKEDQDIMDVWEGVKIGHDIYVKMQRKKNILRNGDNYRQAQLDYFGVTSKFGIYDKSYALQMLYNIVMSHIEFAINQAGGKAVTIYLDDIPIGDDGKPKYELEDIIYMAKVQGVIVKQRKEGAPPMGYADNYQQVDFGLSQTINNLILFKQMIEQTASRMTGVSPDQLGFTSPYQAVRVTESNISQGNAVLEPIYYIHSKMMETCLQKMADLMKVVWSKDETKAFILGDMGFKTLQLSTNLSLSDYGIFLRNTMSDAETKQYLLQAIQQTLAVDPTMIKEFIQVYNASSGVEAEKIVENAIDAMRELQKQQQEQAAQQAQANAELQQAAMQQKSQIAADLNAASIEKSRLIAASVTDGKNIEGETAIDVQLLKNSGALDTQQLKDHNASGLQEDQIDQQEKQSQRDSAIKIKQLNKPAPKPKPKK